MSAKISTRHELAEDTVRAETEALRQGAYSVFLPEDGSDQTMSSGGVRRCVASAEGPQSTWNSHSVTLEMRMFRSTRDDTLIKTVEARYGVDLHARGDTKLGNLLEKRGFESLTQLLQAYRGNLTYHASKRRIYLSFLVEDLAQVRGFRLMSRAPNLEIDFYDGSLREVINSTRGSYIKQQIRSIIQRTSIVVCLIGNGTAWREWVDWELNTALELGKGICGIRLRDSRGKTPQLLNDIDAPIARWGDVQNLIAVIECAAARRC